MSQGRYRPKLMVAAMVWLAASSTFAIDISNRYRSPRNPERKIRQSTELIVLHTTEAPARSSLNKVSERGECHFVVTEEGSVYRIVDRDREAFHAGRSMWKGREDVDKFSVGIECVGYHDKPMSGVQLSAIRGLVKELQGMYRISDDRVVCHSHVAYGAPNKWQKRRHRGRKRCGMLFAMPSVRRVLGLTSRPAGDVDTRAGRLAIGDPYLNTVLYGRTDTMVGRVGSGVSKGDLQQSGDGSWWSRLIGKDPSRKVAATPKSSSPPKPLPTATAKPAPVMTAKPSVTAPKSIAALMASGYKLRGVVSKGTSAIKLAGSRWNAADTYYVIRGNVTPGNRIDPARIENGAGVWTK